MESTEPKGNIFCQLIASLAQKAARQSHNLTLDI